MFDYPIGTQRRALAHPFFEGRALNIHSRNCYSLFKISRSK
jgi:hypothetical protein